MKSDEDKENDDSDDVELQIVPSSSSSSSSRMKHEVNRSLFFRYFFTWIPVYTYDLFQNDVLAGFTVFFLLIPQGLSYAVLAGTPPVYGLYTSVTPALVYMVFGSSMQLSIGPMAITSLLISTTMNDLGYFPETTPADVYVDICRVMAFVVGVILMAMGMFRLGVLTNFLSSSVIKGFTTGSALIIAVSQAKHVLGYTESPSIYIYT